MSTRRHNLTAAFLILSPPRSAPAAAGAQAEPTLECGNAYYDDGESVGFDWFGGGEAGDPDRCSRSASTSPTSATSPGFVEITGICAGNLLSVGGLWANDIYVYPDNEGVPDDSVVLAVGRVLTGNGTGESIVVFDEPVTLARRLLARQPRQRVARHNRLQHRARRRAGRRAQLRLARPASTVSRPPPSATTCCAPRCAPPTAAISPPAWRAQPGANDTQWRSKLAILNPGDRPVGTAVRFLGTDGVPVEVTTTVEAGELVAWDDVLQELFEISEPASGSIRVAGDGPLVVTARTYNASDTGTLGQYLPGVAIDQVITADDRGFISQLANNQQFRTNIGFLNLGDRVCRISTTLFDVEGTQVGDERIRQIDPSGWKQDNDIFALTGAGSHDNAYAVIQVLTDGCTAWAYASVIDNATGDPTTIPVVIR